MFNKTKANLKLKKDSSDLQRHYGFRKFSVGLAGALLSSTFLLTGTGHAVHAANTNTNNDPDTATDENTPENDIKDFKTTDDLEDENDADDVSQDTTVEKSTDQAKAKKEKARKKRLAKLKAEEAKKKREEAKKKREEEAHKKAKAEKEAEAKKEASKDTEKSSDKEDTSITSDEDSTDDLDDNTAEEKSNADQTKSDKTSKSDEDKTGKSSDDKEAQDQEKSTKDDTDDLKSSTSEDQTKQTKKADELDKEANEKLQKQEQDAQKEQKSDQAKLDQAKEADQKQEAKLNAQLKRDEEQQAARQAKSVEDLQKEDKLSTEQANKLKDALNDSEVQDQLRASAIRTQALTDSKETTTNLNDNKTKQAAENDEARQESGDIDVSNTDPNAQVTRTYTINYRYPQESDIQSYSNTYTIRKKRSAKLDPATGETTYGKWQDAGSNLKTTKININTMHVEGYKLNTNIPTDQLSTENGQNYVSYLNDENGDPNDPANLKPSFDYTVNYAADTPSTNTFTVPKFTRMTFRPAMFMTLAANDDEEDNKSETRTRIIIVHKADGTTHTETQSVTATDLQNGLFPKFDLSSYIPSGYEARINDKNGNKVAYVSEMDATIDDPETQTTNVYIVPKEQTVQIKYFDDTSGQEVMTKQYTGHHGDVVKIGINDPSYGPGAGYQFAGSDPDNATITLTGVDSFTIHIKEKGQTVLHTSPIPAYSSDGHGGYYPAGLDENDLNRTLTRTINVTLPNGQLSQIEQKVQLYRDATYNAAKAQGKQVTYTNWKSDKGDIAFEAYTPNQVQGYTPVYEVNGKEYSSVPAESITDILNADPTLSADDNLNNYNDPRLDINYEKAEGQIVVAFVDNANSGRTIKTVTVNGKPGSHLDFKSDPKLAIPNNYQLDPSSQALYDAGYDFAADGSTNNVTLSVIAKSTDVSETDPGAHKIVTRTIRITYPEVYLNDHSNDPTIDQTTGQQIVKQTLVFKRSAQKDAATGQVNYGEWQYQDPNTKQWMNVSGGVVTMSAYTVPEIPGYSANVSGGDLGENYIYADSNDDQDQTIDVTYTGDVQTGTVKFVDDDNNKAVVGTWQFSGRASENVPISPQIPDDRYQLASNQEMPKNYTLTAGSDNTITVHLVHKKHNVTEAEAPNQLERTITRTINVTTPDQGQGTSLETTPQSVTFTRTGVMDDVTGKITYGQWTAKDGKDTFDEFVPKDYPGFKPDVPPLSKVTVTPDTQSSVVNISYDQGKASLTVNFQDKDGKIIGSQVLGGITGETVNYGLALQPPTGYKIVDKEDTNGNAITPTYVLNGKNPTVTVKVQHTSTVEDDTMIVKRVISYVDENGNEIAPKDTINLVLHRDKTVDDVDKSNVTVGDWKPASFDSYSVKPVTGYHLSSTEKHPGNLNVLPAINGVDGKTSEYKETVYFTKDVGDGTVTVKYVNRQGETVGTKKYTGKIGDSIIPTYEQDVPDGYIIDQNANVDVIDITGPTNPDVTITVHKQGEDSQHVVHVKFVSDDGKTVQDETYYGLPGEKKTIDYTITGNWKVKDGQNLPKEYTFINGDNPDITVHVQDTTPEQKTGTLEIQYVDDDDNQKVVSSQTLTLPVDPQYSPSYQIPDGYRLSDSETPPTTYPIIEGQNKPLQIHVSEINKSVPQKISKHIYYVDDEHGWTIDSTVISGNDGSSMNLTYNIPAGYTQTPGQNLPTSYTFSQIGGDVTVKIHKNEDNSTLNIKYVDENNAVVKTTSVSGAVGEYVTLDYKAPDGYQFDQRFTADNPVQVTKTPKDVIVHVTKNPVPSTDRQIKVYYEDEHGWTLDKTQIVKGKVGQTVNISYDVPAGYQIDTNRPPVQSYTFTQDNNTNITVHVTSVKKQVPITVQYKDSETSTIVSAQQFNGTVGNTFSIPVQIPAGYEQDTSQTTDNNVFIDNDKAKTVTFYVKKIPAPSTNRTLTIHYIQSGTKWDAGTQVINGQVGQTVNINYQIPNGFHLPSNANNPKTHAFTQEGTDDSITVVVDKDINMGTVHFKFVNKATDQEVGSQDVTGPLKESTDFVYNIPSGYELDPSQTYATSIFPDQAETTQEIKVQKIQAPSTKRTLIITYHDTTTGNDLGGQQMVDGEAGKTIDLKYNVPNGYALSNDAPKSYTFKENGDNRLTINVTPSGNQSVVNINYIDKVTNKTLHSQQIKGTIGTSWPSITTEVPDGYEIAPDQTYNLYGTFDKTPTTINITIQKKEPASTVRSLIITYHDVTTGNDLSGQQTVTGNAGKTVDLKFQVPEGYQIDPNTPKTYTFSANGENRLTVNVTPVGNQGSVTVNYIEQGTNKKLDSKTITGKIGDSWPKIDVQVPDGYEVVPDQSYNLYGTFTKNPQHVDIMIRKKQAASTERTLIITYHDTKNNIDLDQQQTVTGDAGKSIDLKYNVPNGYDLSPNAPKTYTMTEDVENRLTVDVTPNTQIGEFDIRYYDNSDGHLIDTQKITGPVDESYPDITLKVPTGYDIVKGQTYNLYGTFTDKPQYTDIKVEKHHDTKQQYSYRVRFIDKTTGNQIGNDQIFTGDDGSTKNLTYKLPDGYKIADGQNPAKRHTFSSKDDQADPVQIMIVPDKAQGTFTIEFIDRLTSESKGQMTFTGPVGEEPKLDFDTMALPNGYKLDPDHTPDPYNHKFSDQAQDPYKVYVVPNVTPDNQRKLTITYQAPDGSSQGTQEITGAAGQQITINYQYPSGWTAKSPDALTKTFTFDKNGDSTMTVNVVSTAKTGTIKVDYVDSDIHQVVDSQTFTGNVDDSIDLTDKFKLPAGYEADPDATTQTNFTIKSGTQTIQYLVRKPRDVNQRTVRISYINPDNYAIDHKDVVAKVGDVLNITDQLPAGYTLDTARQKGNNTYTVLDVDDRQVVNVYVLPNANKGKVVVTYINTRTQSPVGTQEIFGDVGDYLNLYDKYKVPDNYKLDPDKTPTPSVNIKDKNPINIQVFVLPSVDNARTLTINYIDPEGHTAGTQTVDGMVGNKVQLSLNAPSGFEIDPDQNIPQNYTFTVNNNQQMNIKVKAKANVNTGTAVINYINKATNESVGTQTVTGADGDYLDLNDKYQVPSGYEFSPNDTPQGSVLISKDKPANIDVYVVSKATDSTQTAQIQYVSGDKVISAQDISGKVGEKINLSYNVPNNYKVKDPSQLQKTYTFAQTGNKNVIVEVVKDDKTPDQPTDDQKTIHINYVDDKGVTQKSTEITGKIGSNQKIVYDIPSGYHQADSSQLPSEITLQKDTQDITVHIVKDATPTNQQTIHIIYMNGNQQVGSTDVTGDVGETKNISYQAPNGYEISDTNLPQTYTFKDGNNKDIIVNVKTKSTTPDKPSQGDTQTIHINYMADGQLIKQTALSGKAGESVSVGYDIPEGYQEIAGQDLPESYTFAASDNKDITVNLQKTSTTPDIPETKRPRLTIEYVDENDHVVGSDILYGNKQGDKINVSYDKVPDGYQIVNGQNLPTTYQLTQTGQDLIVKVSKIKQGNTSPDNPSQPDNNTNNQTNPSTPSNPDNPSNPSTPDNSVSDNTNTDNSNSGTDSTDNGQTNVNSPSTSDDQDNADSTSTSGGQNNDQNDQDNNQATEEKKSNKKNTKKPGSHKTTSAPAKSGSSVATSTGSSAGQGHLPQTGNENPEALLAGALLGALGLIALGYNDKRKHDEDLKDSKNN